MKTFFDCESSVNNTCVSTQRKPANIDAAKHSPIPKALIVAVLYTAKARPRTMKSIASKRSSLITKDSLSNSHKVKRKEKRRERRKSTTVAAQAHKKSPKNIY